MRLTAPMFLALLAVCVACGGSHTKPPPSATLDATRHSASAFSSLCDEFLGWYFASRPVRATQLGVHDHDHRLPDLSPGGIERSTRELHGWLERLVSIDADTLQAHERYDREILEHAIRGQLLELEHVAGWRHNPMLYTRAVADGIASLIDREFAPLEQRLESLVTRLHGVQDVVRAARKNLDGAPQLWVELALRNTRGTIGFLGREVPQGLRAQGLAQVDPQLVRRWKRARNDAVDQLDAFAVWLRDDLAWRENREFRLGRDVFQRKLLYDEHIDVDIDELNEFNEAAIREYQAWVEKEAARVDPNRTAREVMASIAADYPPPDELIETARRFVDEAREFVLRRRIVTLPSDELPIVRPTPRYARSGFASMSTPGPFERRATEAYYNITTVDPAWSDEQQAQHLTYFNRPGLLGISVHEVMPGHFVQLLFRQQIPTDVRKVFLPASFIEGWAHYTEQMMVDEGLGDGDPRVRLGQLRRALQRHARWYAGLAMHVYDVPLEEAARRFEEIAYFAPFPALRETQRGTYDPTYLYYAHGRMEIFKLRDEYRRHKESRGETFELAEFHDRLLRLGLPLPLARRALLRQ
ncbi:MAG: DUF885 domain-containing protein [bacterium]|nr:DUF885 domain-containing protein [bacterium]